MRDLHAEKDGAWMTRYPEAGEVIALGEVGVHGDGADLAIVTYGNGCYLSRQAVRRLSEQGIKARIIDIRWLSPLPSGDLIRAVEGCGRILIVDECRISGGPAEALMALFAERTALPVRRLCAKDSFIATGPAYAATMPSADDIAETAAGFMREPA
jgi:2-oxoisovalerate dehydrogenase E1 component